MSKLHSIEVSRSNWALIVWSPVIVGALVFAFGNSTFVPSEYKVIGSIGGLLIGWGFGLCYSRLWKIRGIDK